LPTPSSAWSTPHSGSVRFGSIDPAQDGADVGFAVLDRLRVEMLHRVGLHDLLKPARLV
jgi:hypothetical protein